MAISNTSLKRYQKPYNLDSNLQWITGKKEPLDIINMSYRHTDSNFNRGFIQSLITSITNHHTPTHNLPRRYITALTNLAKNKNIIIISLDKGRGIAILDTMNNIKN